MRAFLLGSVIAACAVAPALAQSADYRVRADFRTPDNGAWGANQSVGNADFRVHSRFLAVYYGGVMRQDDFTLSVQIDFTGISGYATSFPTSSYNTNFDVYFNDFYIGRAIMGQTTPGIAELGFKSRHPTPPQLPVPANWPSPIEVGTAVRVFTALPFEPTFGDPLPATGSPVFNSPLQEKFARGDVNQDGHVNLTDFATLAARFDPANLSGPHIGPTAGDFTGDNRCDAADYALMAQNWDSSAAIPALPVACLGVPADPAAVTACRGGSATFSTAGVGTGPFTYQWRKNGVNLLIASNATARSATLVVPNVQGVSVGQYSCLITNSCGSIATATAPLSVCMADFDCSSTITPQDIFSFLSAWFAGDARADVNAQGGDTVQDIFDFLAVWFAGC